MYTSLCVCTAKSPLSNLQIRFEITEVGTTLQWEFFTTSYDIYFEVYLKKKVAEKTEREVIVSCSFVVISFVCLVLLYIASL